jgi:N-methylhydantoinase B/oxoprolinase/acetone carboxylase alpha subunit
MEITISIIGLIVAIAAFYYSFLRKPVDELANLKAQFLATQKLSKSVQELIEEYANKTGSWEKPMFRESNISVKSYLNQMKDSYQENLSDELFQSLSSLKLNKANIESMTKSLETQQSALLQMQAEFRLHLSELNNLNK